MSKSNTAVSAGGQQELPPPTAIRFIVPGREPIRVTVLSPLEWWYSHWDPDERRSRRCGQTRCALCAVGLPVILRFVLLVQLPNGTQALLELRERHRSILQQIAQSPRGFVGAKLEVAHRNLSKHSKIDVDHIGHDASIVPSEISRLMPTLGLPAKVIE